MIGLLDLEECMSVGDCLTLLIIVRTVARPKMQILEVGSWKGKSTSILAQVAKMVDGTVYAVDHWNGSKDSWQEELVKTKDVYGTFCNNMKLLGLDKTVQPIKMSSKKAMEQFDDKSMDMIFIDADHHYEAFKDDVNGWLPKIRNGGLLCGHDCSAHYPEMSDVMKGVIERNLDKEFVKCIGHPGIIKGLNEIFGNTYHQVAKSTIWYYVVGAG